VTLRIEPLRWWQLPEVLDIERQAFTPDDWSVETFWGELAQRERRSYLALLDGAALIGYAGLALGGDEAYVQTIAVGATRRGEGGGALLLTALLELAVRRGASHLLLEVRATDEVAQALYASAGFQVIGRRRGYYQASGEDALVMRCEQPLEGAAALRRRRSPAPTS
jgi:ribosomal-protein-alanine N-acetyltransferase